MSKKSNIEELSAYLDGESSNPEGIKRLLQRSEEEAQRFMAYRKLSSYLQELPQRDVHPGFATRVVAHASDITPLGRAWWRVPGRIGTFAAAFLILIVGSVYLSSDVTWPNIVPTQPSTVVAVQAESIAEELERRAEEEPDTLMAGLGAWVDLYEDETVSEDDPLIHEFDLMLEELETAFDTNADLDTMMGSLSELEWESLDTLLENYVTGIAG